MSLLLPCLSPPLSSVSSQEAWFGLACLVLVLQCTSMSASASASQISSVCDTGTTTTLSETTRMNSSTWSQKMWCAPPLLAVVAVAVAVDVDDDDVATVVGCQKTCCYLCYYSWLLAAAGAATRPGRQGQTESVCCLQLCLRRE